MRGRMDLNGPEPTHDYDQAGLYQNDMEHGDNNDQMTF